MRISKRQIPAKINIPGAVARVVRDSEIILFSPQHEHAQAIYKDPQPTITLIVSAFNGMI